ncbi:LysR family transcriptional regulator [Palleronia rufa]|uniref:LysR family transcriptional regulator n=1 Tax=Palleronia rufa TaxID=1530186 RepID=UPI00068CC502|nr:LysR substrate-binding domain-containing protein [Palleronia rufa]
MDTRHLRFFVAVVEAGSITRAAEALNISQPALTVGVRNLEAELDAQLFDRLPRGVRMTSTGEALYRHARTVFTQIEDARTEIETIKRLVKHEVRIGVGPIWLRQYLPGIVARMTRAHPGYEIIVRGGYEQSLFSMLRTGEIEFALTEIADTSTENAFVTQVLTTDRYSVLCRKGHPLTGHGPISLAELEAFHWAMPDQADYAKRRLNGLFHAQNLPAPMISLRSDSLRFITHVLLESDMLSFVVLTGSDDNLGSNLQVLETQVELPSRSAGIVRRSGGLAFGGDAPPSAGIGAGVRDL